MDDRSRYLACTPTPHPRPPHTPMDHCLQPYPGDAQRAHILTVGGGAVPCPPGPCQQATQALDANASVDGVLRRGWRPHQAGTGIIIAY